MLCCSAHKFHLLCSILYSCERFVLRNTVLCYKFDCFIRVYSLDIINIIIMVTVLLEYIDL